MALKLAQVRYVVKTPLPVRGSCRTTLPWSSGAATNYSLAAKPTLTLVHGLHTLVTVEPQEEMPCITR